MPHVLSRRQFIATSAVAGLGATRFASWARSAPSATVSIGKCGSYGADLVPGSALAARYEPLIVGRPAFISFQKAAELRYGARNGRPPSRMFWRPRGARSPCWRVCGTKR